MAEFQLMTKLIWGMGSVSQLFTEVRNFGFKALVIGGASTERNGIFAKIISELSSAPMRSGTEIRTLLLKAKKGEPTLKGIEELRSEARLFGPDVVIGAGGGSVMDTAKALAGLIPNPGAADEYFYGKEMEEPPLPVITIPTIFGSGAEVTFNAVLSDDRTGIKQSLRDRRLTPRVTLIDPEFAKTVPQESIVYSGLDGLTQSIEAFVSNNASGISDLFAQDGVIRFARAFKSIIIGEYSNDVLEDLAYGSMSGGIALAAARLGAVHGLAHPIGVLYNQPHGKVCATLLPGIMKYNLPVVTEKYARLAKVLNLSIDGDEVDQAASLIKFVWSLNKKLGIPLKWRELGIKKEDFPILIERSLPSGSLKANPRKVEEDDLYSILRENY